MTKHRVIIGDSRQMTELDDKSVQLVITSPPYWGMNRWGLNKAHSVGPTSQLIRNCSPKTFEEWEKMHAVNHEKFMKKFGKKSKVDNIEIIEQIRNEIAKLSG